MLLIYQILLRFFTFLKLFGFPESAAQYPILALGAKSAFPANHR